MIHPHCEYWYFPYDTLVLFEADPIITLIDGDLVSIRTAIGFDTLCDFGAAPGDHWLITLEYGSNGWSNVMITDTGRTVIDGVELRYVAAGTAIVGWPAIP